MRCMTIQKQNSQNASVLNNFIKCFFTLIISSLTLFFRLIIVMKMLNSIITLSLLFLILKSKIHESSFFIWAEFSYLSIVLICQHYSYWHLSFPRIQSPFPNSSMPTSLCGSIITFLYPHAPLIEHTFSSVLPFEHLPVCSSSRTPLGHHRHPSRALACQKGQLCCSTQSLHLQDRRGPRLWAQFLLFHNDRRGIPGHQIPEETENATIGICLKRKYNEKYNSSFTYQKSQKEVSGSAARKISLDKAAGA